MEKNGVMVEELVRVGTVPITVVGNRDRVESQEKRTRFSLSHDDGSIGKFLIPFIFIYFITFIMIAASRFNKTVLL